MRSGTCIAEEMLKLMIKIRVEITELEMYQRILTGILDFDGRIWFWVGFMDHLSADLFCQDL